MYFNSFSKGFYDIKGDGNLKLVTDLNTRIRVSEKISESAYMYSKYNVISGDNPEDVSFYHFGSSHFHWIILLTNNITDRYTQWPMDPITFEKYIVDKYESPNDIHHYEIEQSSGNTTPTGPADYSNKIQVSSDISGATTVSNREYEERLQDRYRQIKLLRRELLPIFLKEFDRIMGTL